MLCGTGSKYITTSSYSADDDVDDEVDDEPLPLGDERPKAKKKKRKKKRKKKKRRKKKSR